MVVSRVSLFVLFLLLLNSSTVPPSFSIFAAEAAEDRANKSSWGGLFWSTSKDQTVPGIGDSYHEAADSGADDEFNGAYSSLDSMLQWAIGHSDPAKLREKANEAKRLSPNELRERHAEIKELMDKLKNPSDGELMKIAIADLNNSSLSSEDHQRALDELLILVEHIDNANDLDRLGGLISVVRELHNSDSKIRTTSAWVLGKACQNNPLVQKQTLAHGALPILMKIVKSGHAEEAIKAFYAISTLIRNNNAGVQMFYAEAGESMLQDIISNSSIDNRLRKKAVSLATDLADFQFNHMDDVKFPFYSNGLFLKSVVDLTSSSDLDLQEKALLALRSLLQLRYIEVSVLKDVCNLDGALEGMREQLEKLMEIKEHKEFAVDLESLRREVETIFRGKLEKVDWVPT